MIKLLNQKNTVLMDEYYVLHFYQVRPTIKYYLVLKIIYKFMRNFICYVFYIFYTYDIILTVDYIFLCLKILNFDFVLLLKRTNILLNKGRK
jgi:hypothetical protein